MPVQSVQQQSAAVLHALPGFGVQAPAVAVGVGVADGEVSQVDMDGLQYPSQHSQCAVHTNPSETHPRLIMHVPS